MRNKMTNLISVQHLHLLLLPLLLALITGSLATVRTASYSWSYTHRHPPTGIRRTYQHYHHQLALVPLGSGSGAQQPIHTQIPNRNYYYAYPPPPPLPSHPMPLFGGRLPFGPALLPRVQLGPIQPIFQSMRPPAPVLVPVSSLTPSPEAPSAPTGVPSTSESSTNSFSGPPARPANDGQQLPPSPARRLPPRPLVTPARSRPAPSSSSLNRSRLSPPLAPSAPTGPVALAQPSSSLAPAAPASPPLPAGPPAATPAAVNDADIGFDSPSNSESSSLAGPVVPINSTRPLLPPANSNNSGLNEAVPDADGGFAARAR